MVQIPRAAGGYCVIPVDLGPVWHPVIAAEVVASERLKFRLEISGEDVGAIFGTIVRAYNGQSLKIAGDTEETIEIAKDRAENALKIWRKIYKE